MTVPGVLANPEIAESDGEWTYNEGCLSVPELSWEIVRPRRIHLRAVDLDGNEVSIEAEDLQARLFQHELDHLDGKMLLDYLDDDQRRGRQAHSPPAGDRPIRPSPRHRRRTVLP